MKKRIALIFILSIGCTITEKEFESVRVELVKVVDSSYLASKTSYFKVQNDSIIGDGATVFRTIFKESQFVVFGERHNSKATSELTKALIPMMSSAGFKTLCFEIGPHSATKLTELSSNYETTIEYVASFNSKYQFKPENDYPIAFFTGREDVEFLQSASKFGMEIWGIDQEYYYAVLYLTDELLKLAVGKSNFETIQKDKENADVAIMKWFMLEVNSDKEIDVFAGMQNEPDLITFFNHFSAEDKKAKAIINDLEISWDIYSRWRRDSHADRISYMRNNFLSNFKGKDKDTKVFLKFGQVHASQTISKGAYDIGNLTNELALKNGTISSNINSWTRFYKEDSTEIDYLKKYAAYYERIQLFMNCGKRDAFAIINLKSIRKDISNNKIQLPTNGDYHKINALLQAYDFQLILPLDEQTTAIE